MNRLAFVDFFRSAAGNAPYELSVRSPQGNSRTIDCLTGAKSTNRFNRAAPARSLFASGPRQIAIHLRRIIGSLHPAPGEKSLKLAARRIRQLSRLADRKQAARVERQRDFLSHLRLGVCRRQAHAFHDPIRYFQGDHHAKKINASADEDKPSTGPRPCGRGIVSLPITVKNNGFASTGPRLRKLAVPTTQQGASDFVQL